MLKTFFTGNTRVIVISYHNLIWVKNDGNFFLFLERVKKNGLGESRTIFLHKF
ncbi:hypothetical protein C2G38_303268 [Gigaspora rosea]|uniref:Uncharacterized protein n=1 Tax=Gigaspora rosea TaxID=44941 RepID=A0A397UFR7_9GLOM|nr:hypothetical protein C2G38_303268 [Gigaspora rosea]